MTLLERIHTDLARRYHDKPHRLAHVLGVRDTALHLANLYGGDESVIQLAALLHDITKYEDIASHRQWIDRHHPDPEGIYRSYPMTLWHAFSASAYAHIEYGITDERVLEAIEHHTVGAPAMCQEAAILFLADYIEPNRTYSSCVKVRAIAETDFVRAIFTAMDDTIRFHEQEGATIPEIAYDARTYYQTRLEESL
jgi:predicted HD superfamily hydrolase involved in NAD metabolism